VLPQHPSAGHVAPLRVHKVAGMGAKGEDQDLEIFQRQQPALYMVYSFELHDHLAAKTVIYNDFIDQLLALAPAPSLQSSIKTPAATSLQSSIKKPRASLQSSIKMPRASLQSTPGRERLCSRLSRASSRWQLTATGVALPAVASPGP
jgi:hypothetical protein